MPITKMQKFNKLPVSKVCSAEDTLTSRCLLDSQTAVVSKLDILVYNLGREVRSGARDGNLRRNIEKR